MLSMAKVGRGRQAYYLATVATGREHDGGLVEPDGVWLGGAAAALGLDGVVRGEQLDAILAGVHPVTREVLSASHARRVTVAGFDCTFAPPKSVSVLHALGPAEARDEVRASHDAAVSATLDYLERHAACSRRRGAAPGARVSLAVGGVVAAAFVHRASRAPDPHLHTHVLMANCAPGDDGRWTPLDARPLFLALGTASHLYEAEVRREIDSRLGLRFGPLRGSWADLEGIDGPVLGAFSRRSAEIEQWLGERGIDGPRARRLAAVATRAPKDLDVPYETLLHGWRETALSLGLPSGELGRLVEAGRRRDRGRSPSAGNGAGAPIAGAPIAGAGAWVDEVLGPSGLTARAASFTRDDLIRARCRALPAGGTVGEVEAVVDAVLGSSRVVEVGTAARGLRGGPAHKIPAGVAECRFTTPEILAVESALIERARVGPASGMAIADTTSIGAAFGVRPLLGDRPREVASALVTSGRAIDSVSAGPFAGSEPRSDAGRVAAGPAAGPGAGPVAGPSGSHAVVSMTDALDASRAAWTASGISVRGIAPDRQAALRLEAATGVETVSLADCGLGPDRFGWLTRTPGGPAGVLVVGGADRIDPRSLSSLFDAAGDAGTKLVLVSGRGIGRPDARAVRAIAEEAGRSPLARAGEGRRAPAGFEPDLPGEPIWLGAGGVGVGLAASAAAARAAAVRTFESHVMAGEAALLVAPDRPTLEALRSELAGRDGSSLVSATGASAPGPAERAAIVRAAEVAAALENLPAARLVVLGDAALLPSSLRRLAGTERTHVVVDRDHDPAARRARAAEVALAPRVVREIGAPPRGAEGRAAWRRAAVAAEDRRALQRDPVTGRGHGIDVADAALREARREVEGIRRARRAERVATRSIAVHLPERWLERDTGLAR